MRLRPTLLGLAAALAIGQGVASGPANAREAVSDDVLQTQRGGFLIADGVTFDFGAVLNTYEDGVLILQTTINWTAAGQQVTQTLGAGVTTLPPGDLGALSGMGQGFLTPAGVTVVHDIAQGQILNLVLNTQSNVNLRQDSAITLVLPGFAATQAQIVQQLTGLQLQQQMASAAILHH